jgi:NET1-associated nuclear protein 1 (U3 small nucleolar RNA-associated protein 17)
MRQFLVGGPLLGTRQQRRPSLIASWNQFEPLITPEISLDKQQPQRFILLPHDRYISVLAYNTGSRLASLVPFQDGEEGSEENNILIESVCLTKHSRKVPKATVQDVLNEMDIDKDGSNNEAILEIDQIVDEIIVMVGCRDGTIREFSLEALSKLDDSKAVNCGPYQISGPCCRPRRVIRLSKKEPIIHLTVPVSCNLGEGILTYVVTITKDLNESSSDDKNAASTVNVSLLRVMLPHFDGSTSVSLLSKSEDGIKRKYQIDNIKCRVGKDKAKRFLDTVPFRLLSVARPTKDSKTLGKSVFVVLARANGISIYYEDLQSSHRFSPMSFPMPPSNPLSAISISKNNADVTCGHYRGEIKVLNKILDALESYHIGMAQAERHFGSDEAKTSVSKPTDPRKALVTSKVHWHAHPVTSLVYDTTSSPIDPILYSGGEESVLVTWQTSRGTDRPTDVLPRLALGGIVHVACADRIDANPSNGVLVYCEDNSLQLFESHNKGRKWKLQGLACKEKVDHKLSKTTCIEGDPRAQGFNNSQLIIVGLSEAPGFMHWYDSSKQQLLGSLEVAPFNRISRTEDDDFPLPTPSITNHIFSDDGSQLVTLEETPTENLFIGSYERKGNEEYGIVSTIRFWSWRDSSATQGGAPYALSAAMTYPHGPKNRVSALTLTKDGSMACTISNDEKAFRVWHKVIADEEDDESLPTWTCRYKVTIPAGFSNFLTSRDGVAFSDDSSIIAIAFGSMVTLWDSVEARFLKSIRHLEDFTCPIDSIKFVKTGKLQDLLLIKSDLGVSLQSPFGNGANLKGWSWGLPPASKNVIVTDTALIRTHGCVAISVFDSTMGQSRLVFIDIISGKAGVNDNTSDNMATITGIDGCVQCMCAPGKPQKRSNWESDDSDRKVPLNLFTLTSSGALLKFTNGADDSPTFDWKVESKNSGPRLDISRGDNSKHQRTESTQLEDLVDDEPVAKKAAVEIFGLSLMEANKATPPPTAELPALSTAFVRAFVGRGLSRGITIED